MRKLLLGLVVATGCVGAAPPGGGGGGDDTPGPDGGVVERVCPLPSAMPDAGDLLALKAESCNVNGSMGLQKWYRVSATLADTGDIVQLELWPGTGAFLGGPVTVGTFPVETNYATCGVCLRGMGDKGLPTAKEFFGTAGSVEITAVDATTGAPISATITNATMVEVDALLHQPVAGGCTSSLSRVKVSGTVTAIGGTGGGGGGGGGGGSGAGACPAGVGD